MTWRSTSGPAVDLEGAERRRYRELDHVGDRQVVDQTGLSGKFDFQFEWRPEQLGGQPGATPPPLPPEVEARSDMFNAFQEQLGLKLESTRTAVEVYVIDKVQKPSDN